MTRRVFFTVDAEQDCPPYLDGWRGMEEGAPRLFDLLAEEGVPATVFTTGEAAHRHPDAITRLLEEGHELACHGMTHRSFGRMTVDEAREEIQASTEILRAEADVVSFRAPYLTLPDRHLALLEEEGYRLDSSRGRYKPAHWGPSAPTTLHRVPASTTSSWLRLPGWLRDPILGSLVDPVVLFVHPWEFVDLTGAAIPWDCRTGTGEHALESLREVLRRFRARGAHFGRMAELVPGGGERQERST